MHVHSVSRKHKWRTLLAGLSMLALVAAVGLVWVNRANATPGVTLVVATDGKATANNCNSNTVTPYTTVSAAVAAASAGDTIKVCAGSYSEDVTVDKTLTLKGARFGDGIWGRTFGDASESTITGLLTIQAQGVKVEGFSLTNPGEGLGVLVKNTANDAIIKKNMIQTVGNNTFVGPVVGIYLELGPDGVTISGNAVSDIQSQTGSAQGVLVGDSTSADPSVNIRIDHNTFKDITSVQKGAYGIQLNNGANSAPTSTGYTEAKIRGNTIKNLTGTWVHAVGLEGETPNVVVDNNVISDLMANPASPNVVGVFFEDNPFFFTAEVNQNSLDVGATNFGIAVHPNLTTHYSTLDLDGTCNWWGAKNGPSTVGTGSGSMVSAGVDFDTFLKSANINRDCDDHDHHSNHGWSDRDDSDWRHDD